MPALEFVGQSERDPSNIAANPSRLINLYPEPLPAGSRAAFALKSVPGTTVLATLDGVFTRALSAVSGRLFAVIGGALVEVTATGGTINRGAVADGDETSVSANSGDIAVAAAGTYRVLSGTSLTTPSLSGLQFSDVGSVEFLAGRTILTQRAGRVFMWSDLADASTFDALNFATAELRDDAILRAVAINGNLWIFKEGSTEIWFATGEGGALAFAPVPGGLRERGLLGYGLVAKIPDGAVFVGDDGIVYLASGDAMQAISTPAVNESIAAETPTHAAYYEHDGHKFCVIRFDDRPAWVFDMATQLWHERATDDGAWSATHLAYFGGRWLAGTTGGRVLSLGGTFADADGPLRRVAVSRPLTGQGRRFVVSEVELLGRVGLSDLSRPAVAMVRASRDGGFTWGATREASFGSQGQYDRRAVLRSWGQARQFVMEVSVTDPTELTLLSAANVVLS
jgi:hypothetical protein